MGVPIPNIRGMYETDGILGRGGVLLAVVQTDGCGKTSEDHSKRGFVIRVGASVTGIWKAWWGQERRERVVLWW